MNKILLWMPVLVIALFWSTQALSHEVYETRCEKVLNEDQQTISIFGLLALLSGDDTTRAAGAALVAGAVLSGDTICEEVEKRHKHKYRWIKEYYVEWL